MGYFLNAPGLQTLDWDYRVVDSRGTWFLGAAPHRVVAAGFYLLRSLASLLAARLSGGPCIAHVNITGRGSTIRKIVLLNFARWIGLHYLLHVHDPAYADDYRRRGRVMQRAVASVFRGAEMVLLLGQGEQASLVPLMGLSPQIAHVLHNAVPDPHPALPRRGGDGPCRLLFLGYLSARKGVPELLRALASDQLVAANWELVAAGNGPVDEFRALAASLGVADRIQFPGWLDEAGVQAACAAADIIVLPSHAEGLAMAVLEGLAHGLAVVATPVGAHSEVIEPEVSGVLVPPGDIGALANALRRVIDDDALRARLQNGARQRFLASFDVGAYAERLSQLHGCLLAGQHPLATRPAPTPASLAAES
jgi:glycosyltransferase involved in cell wall biosynthesis